ncbi:leucine-specific transport system, periplasmic-binding protein LivK [Cystobacter fuscus]|uniref:Leucine-specific transport system, periplasmic-binding protein LivK n=1 Tax=Cystobacter fuscus TaxID=43 RepID=A0A250JG19_9BACT|nr:kelch repeat-containing protein [Cystobacter fuscus]ATB42096.1 leucine-specific transport system, periplasmic-binding protein LivK [Cystobacter fuscus]
MRTALGLSLLVLGVSFTVGCGPERPISESITNTVQGETTNSSVVMLDSGLVLVAGGRPHAPGSEWNKTASALYDPVKNEWKPTGEINEPRQLASAVKLPSGEVLLSGGQSLSSGELLKSMELYDPVAGTWKTTSDLSRPRYKHQSTLLPSGKILVTGGRTLIETPTGEKEADATTAELYDPATNQWSSAGNLRYSTLDATVISLGSGEVMTLSNHGVDIYNPEANTWIQQEYASPFVAPPDHAATRLDSNEILVTGGSNGLSYKSTALYYPSMKIWISGPPLNKDHWKHKTIPLTKSKALAIGGIGGVELYDPTNTKKPWTDLGEDPKQHGKGNAILLSENKVLLWGGLDERTDWTIFTLPKSE